MSEKDRLGTWFFGRLGRLPACLLTAISAVALAACDPVQAGPTSSPSASSTAQATGQCTATVPCIGPVTWSSTAPSFPPDIRFPIYVNEVWMCRNVTAKYLDFRVIVLPVTGDDPDSGPTIKVVENLGDTTASIQGGSDDGKSIYRGCVHPPTNLGQLDDWITWAQIACALSVHDPACIEKVGRKSPAPTARPTRPVATNTPPPAVQPSITPSAPATPTSDAAIKAALLADFRQCEQQQTRVENSPIPGCVTEEPAPAVLSAINVKWSYCKDVPDLVVQVDRTSPTDGSFTAYGTCAIAVTYTIPPDIVAYAGTYTDQVAKSISILGRFNGDLVTIDSVWPCQTAPDTC